MQFLRALLAFCILGLAKALQLRMSTVVVFGATGKTGREVVWQSLKQGFNVIALARDSSRMMTPLGSCGKEELLKDSRLTVVTGSVTDPAAVAKTFAAAPDAVSGVVVSLGGKTKDVGKTMLADGTRNIIDEMKKTGVKRVSVVTSIGAGDSESQAPMMFKALMYTVMKSIFEDKNNQEKLFLEGPGKDLDYTIVRPGGLGEGAPTGVINVINGQAGSIMRSDVAAFCLGAITDASFPYLKQTPCISSVGGTGWVKEPKKGFDGVNTA